MKKSNNSKNTKNQRNISDKLSFPTPFEPSYNKLKNNRPNNFNYDYSDIDCDDEDDVDWEPEFSQFNSTLPISNSSKPINRSLPIRPEPPTGSHFQNEYPAPSEQFRHLLNSAAGCIAGSSGNSPTPNFRQFQNSHISSSGFNNNQSNLYKMPNFSTTYTTNELYEAYCADDINKFRELIKNGKDVNFNVSSDSFVVKIIKSECTKSNKKFLNELLKPGSGLNLAPGEHSKLMTAAIESHSDDLWVKELIKQKIKINDFGEEIEIEKQIGPPIFCAIKNKKFKAMDSLLKAGVDLEICDSGGDTPLNSLILSLLAKKADQITGVDTNIEKYMKIFIEKGADVHQKDARGWMPIHCMVTKGFGAKHEYLYDMMLDMGIDINSKSNAGNTILMMSYKKHHVLDFLIKKGCDLDCQNKNGMSAISASAIFDEEHSFQMLLDAGASVSNIDKDGNNIIHLLIKNGNKHQYYYNKILEKNPNLIYGKNNAGETPKALIENLYRKNEQKKIYLNLIKQSYKKSKM